MLHHAYVNSVLADETHTSGNNEATKKPSQEMDGCEYHLYYFLMIRLTIWQQITPQFMKQLCSKKSLNFITEQNFPLTVTGNIWDLQSI